MAEKAARFLLFLLLFGGMTFIIGWRWYDQQRSPIIHAHTPETGGWAPDMVTARVGEPLQLRLTSDDVMHGFRVGQIDMEPVDIAPGTITEVTLLFDKPGIYTYYCTRICSVTHWRMRGTIEVLAEDTRPAAPVEPPLYVALAMDIDAPHTAEVIPDKRPSPARGAALTTTLSAEFWSREHYERQSPAQVWQLLREEPSTADLTDAELWDLVGFLWQSQTTPTALQLGQELYTADCASCHGTSGAGDGSLATIQPTAVPDFTDPATMLGANSAVLQGKLLRGGMGTGMPNWGTIFTEEEIWALVDYLWTFQFAPEENSE